MNSGLGMDTCAERWDPAQARPEMQPQLLDLPWGHPGQAEGPQLLSKPTGSGAQDLQL